MNNLKTDVLLIVGEKEDELFFRDYFKEIYLLPNNEKVFFLYKKKNISIIFLDFNQKDTLHTIKEIRKRDKEVIIVILITSLSKKNLKDLLPLHLSGCLQKPFNKNSFEKLFQEHILFDLNISKRNKVKIKSHYIFDREEHLLYNSQFSQIKLTKHELKLLSLLSLSKNNFLTTESLEYSIWEDESSFCDCNNRLKYLVSTIRKKLPKDSLVNLYGSGYKLLCEEVK